MRDEVEHPTSFVEASQKGEARRAEQQNKREADSKEAGKRQNDERAGIMSDLLLGERSKVSGKSALYYIVHDHARNHDDYAKKHGRRTSIMA